MMSQRDIFLFELLELAKKDKKIILASADMGSPAIDRWKCDLPDRFFSMGISEANTINFCAGMSHLGYKPFAYSMGCWAMRCLEQIRYSCGIANNPITYLAAGVGLGYTPAGPAHASTEDIAYMRSIAGMEIVSPANGNFVRNVVSRYCEDFKLRHIRLERNYPSNVDEYYEPSISENDYKKGYCKLLDNSTDICIISSGYLLGMSLEVGKKMNVSVVDLWRIKPIDTEMFGKEISQYKNIITLEENNLHGGFGSAICEVICDLGIRSNVYRMGLPDKFLMENGNREELLESVNISPKSLTKLVSEIYNKMN